MTFRQRKTYKIDLSPTTYNDLKEPCHVLEANVVGSLRTNSSKYHSPVLDLDFFCRLEPSSREGHFHLYLDDVVLTWNEYEKLLNVLAEVGIISERYRDHSVRQKQTVVRLPWVKKTPDEMVSSYEDYPPDPFSHSAMERLDGDVEFVF